MILANECINIPSWLGLSYLLLNIFIICVDIRRSLSTRFSIAHRLIEKIIICLHLIDILIDWPAFNELNRIFLFFFEIDQSLASLHIVVNQYFKV